MRLIDILFSFPGIIIALTIITILGMGIQNVILAIGISEFQHLHVLPMVKHYR